MCIFKHKACDRGWKIFVHIFYGELHVSCPSGVWVRGVGMGEMGYRGGIILYRTVRPGVAAITPKVFQS